MSSFSSERVIQILGLCIPPILLLMGNIGCICNFITFNDKQLHKNSCTIYFLASSIVDFFILNLNLLSYWMHDGFLIDPMQTKSLFYCKFRNYLVIVLPIVSTSFIILASIDRWAQSSLNINRRNFSNRRMAYSLITLTTIFWFSILSHHFIFYKISNGKCDGSSKEYNIFHGIFNVFCIGIIPSVLLSIFGFLTLRNVRQSLRRVNPTVNLVLNQISRNRKESQLLLMVLVQVITTIVLTGPYLLTMSYITISNYFYDKTEPNQHQQIENLLDLITRDLWYLNYTKTFYIYTLSSTLFRKIFIKRFFKLLHYCGCHSQNRLLQQRTLQLDTTANTI